MYSRELDTCEKSLLCSVLHFVLAYIQNINATSNYSDKFIVGFQEVIGLPDPFFTFGLIRSIR